MKTSSRIHLLLTAAMVLVVLSAPPAHSTTMLPQNVVDLISLSQRILVGEVVGLSDGIGADNLPYTEVTLHVEDSILGDPGSTYTFRQFGLLKALDLPNGKTNLMVSPDGWPKFRQGEEVMVFLYEPGSVSGLQTTVGLLQGKFGIMNGEIVNDIQNQNLFNKVQFDMASMTASERKLVGQRAGALPADEFISLVRKAVQENWIEQGRMIHAN